MNQEELSLVGRDPSIIAPFLKELFNEYDRQGLSWAVMRGWERLPEWTRYDVDILVAQKDLKRAYMLTETLGHKFGWRLPKRSAFYTRRPVWLFRVDANGFSSLRLDIMDTTPFQWRWRDDPVICLSAREKCAKGFWCLPLWYVGASILIKELALRHRVEGELRFDQIQQAAGLPEFRVLLRNALEDDALTDRLVAAAKTRDADELKRLSPRVNGIIAKKKSGGVLAKIAYIWRGVCKRATADLNLFVVLIGPDGCGKTTIADYIQSTFRGRPFGVQMRIKSDFGMPRLRIMKSAAYRLLGRAMPVRKEPIPGTRHMGMQKPHSRLRAMIYVIYYGVGMIIGRIRLILSYPYCRQIIADRYFYDYYYQNGFRNCPRWLVRAMEALAPSPDLILTLDRPPLDIYRGKPELTVEEIEREQRVIKELFGSRRNCCIVNAGEGLDKTLLQVEKVVAENLISRWCK